MRQGLSLGKGSCAGSFCAAQHKLAGMFLLFQCLCEGQLAVLCLLTYLGLDPVLSSCLLTSPGIHDFVFTFHGPKAGSLATRP